MGKMNNWYQRYKHTTGAIRQPSTNNPPSCHFLDLEIGNTNVLSTIVVDVACKSSRAWWGRGFLCVKGDIHGLILLVRCEMDATY